VKTRIHNMLEVRLLYKRLEQTVEKRTAELRESEARFAAVRETAGFLAQARKRQPR
jgi:nitrate/nitrite-specific signal transduction histidine kinase